jgi:hypothetical protein
VVVAALVVAGACGGSVTAGPGDGGGGADGGADVGGGGTDAQPGSDSSAVVDAQTTDTGNPGKPFDGTTGQKCASDADCTTPGGPGIARCSSTVFAPESYFATPVCILPACSPVSGTTPHYCDGPDAPSSPGICEPYGNAGGGVCLPKCTFDKAGGPATGCQGNDVCFVDTQATSEGVGYCWGGCTQDGDCPTGQKCQADQGLCMEGTVPPTKPYGAACTTADLNDGACYCLYGAASTGYCSSFCVVGGPNTCPTGSICDGLEYRQDGYSMSNAGLGGFCTVACTAGSEAGAACPTGASCTDIFASGPDCIP